jgi:MoxR-like ATPase
MAVVDEGTSIQMAADVCTVAETAQLIKDELHRVIVGRDELIEALFLCLLAEGHILLEGNPGLAKTTLTRQFAQTLGCTFNRQQFTPDLLPSDITGSYVYDQKIGEFYVRKGGIFANIVMIDELNRTTPRTQSALLEAMEEKNVTIEGTTFPLEKPFMVLATQTAVDLEGTFPLPQVQIDRFTMKVKLEYPTTDEELQILETKREASLAVRQVTNRDSILRMIDVAKSVYVDEKILEYIRDVVVGSRRRSDLILPASPRASIALLALSRARAATYGRDYVIPDDVKATASDVLSHRVMLSPEAEIEGISIEDVIAAILKDVRPVR